MKIQTQYRYRYLPTCTSNEPSFLAPKQLDLIATTEDSGFGYSDDTWIWELSARYI